MQVGLNNRVLKNLSQSSSKAAVDLLGMRLSTTIKDNFVEILLTETEAYGRKNSDPMSMLNSFTNVPTSLTLGPPHISILKSGSSKGLYILAGKPGSAEAVLIRAGKILIGKNIIEKRRKTKMKTDKLTGPGNITTALGLTNEDDGVNILSSHINLSPRIHSLDRAIAKQRKNAKRNDKHLWRFNLVLS